MLVRPTTAHNNTPDALANGAQKIVAVERLRHAHKGGPARKGRAKAAVRLVLHLHHAASAAVLKRRQVEGHLELEDKGNKHETQDDGRKRLRWQPKQLPFQSPCPAQHALLLTSTSSERSELVRSWSSNCLYRRW